MLHFAGAFEEDVTCRTRFVLSKYYDNWFGEASALACGFESFPTCSRLQHARCQDIQCCYNELFFWGTLADSTCLLGEAVEVLRLKFVVASLFFNMLYNWRLMSIHCSSRCCTVVPFFSGDSFVEQAPYVTTLQH